MRGYTYSEIQKVIPELPKSTLSGWLKEIKLSKNQKDRIIKRVKKKVDRGRIKGAWANRLKAQRRIKKISKEAEKEFKKHIKKSLFLVGLAFYWAEGSRRCHRFQFINSDPEIIKLMMIWLREICKVEENEIIVRLYIHKIYSKENCRQFWSKIVNIPASSFLKTVYKPSPHKIKKNLAYKGCLRIEVRGSELYWKIQTWQKLVAKKFIK